MLLTIDIGNTETVLGVFRADELVWHWRLSTVTDRTADELAVFLSGFLSQRDLSFERDITGVAICSGVPPLTEAMRRMVEGSFDFEPVIVGPGIKSGIPVLTDNPREVGADRIANALAAFTRFGGPCIIADFGTATTYDAVSVKGEYLGGAIAPGMRISEESLTSRAARLPDVEIAGTKSVIGKNTVEAMQSGLLWGTVAELEGMIERMESELGGDVTVVATGGLAEDVVPFTDVIDHYEPWLTLQGLRLIYERNQA
jgi:type III pantothenate kinase